MNPSEDSAESPPQSQWEQQVRQRIRQPTQWREGASSSGESSFEGNRVLETQQQQLEQQQQGLLLRLEQQEIRPMVHNEEEQRDRNPLRPPLQQGNLRRNGPRRPLQQLLLPMPNQQQQQRVRNHRDIRQQEQIERRQQNVHRRRALNENELNNNDSDLDSDSDASFNELIGAAPMFPHLR